MDADTAMALQFASMVLFFVGIIGAAITVVKFINRGDE